MGIGEEHWEKEEEGEEELKNDNWSLGNRFFPISSDMRRVLFWFFHPNATSQRNMPIFDKTTVQTAIYMINQLEARTCKCFGILLCMH